MPGSSHISIFSSFNWNSSELRLNWSYMIARHAFVLNFITKTQASNLRTYVFMTWYYIISRHQFSANHFRRHPIKMIRYDMMVFRGSNAATPLVVPVKHNITYLYRTTNESHIHILSCITFFCNYGTKIYVQCVWYDLLYTN